MFSVFDYSLFSLFLLLSVGVGVYHAIAAKRRKFHHSATEEYLIGGRNLPILPVCLSLLTTFVSGIALLGVPAEIYQRGMGMGASLILGNGAFIVVGVFFIPMFYKLKFVNIYEYFEYRFDSLWLKRIGTFMFIFNCLVYMAIVIYAPAIALSGVADLPLEPFILVVGLCGTLYTTIGGIKAVIWTDTLQAVFLIFGLSMLVVKGTIDAGGMANVIHRAEDTGRLTDSILIYDLNPLQYNNLFIMAVGGSMHALGMFGLNQMSLQRFCSLPSVRDAQKVMVITIPAHLLVGCMSMFLGILTFAYFHGCDPIASGEAKSPDQLAILLAARVLGSIPGMPGLFLSTLFSATLSTVSSGLNSIAAVVFEDWIKPNLRKEHSKSPERLTKLIVLLMGVISTCLAFCCKFLGGIFYVVIATLGATSGPITGVFLLGLFFPKANKFGAFVGFFVSSITMIAVTVSNNIEKPYRNYVLPMIDEDSGWGSCENVTDYSINVIRDFYKGKGREFHYGDLSASAPSRLSSYAYSPTGKLSFHFGDAIGVMAFCSFCRQTDNDNPHVIKIIPAG
uniref:Sodium-coupled monocarboxylate transporter 2 n=1 Tax=Bursaphelenchus xylophilus TaxID=6326 RepID=A0A1I7SE02_BURXY